MTQHSTQERAHAPLTPTEPRGALTRREALSRLAQLGVGLPVAFALGAGCDDQPSAVTWCDAQEVEPPFEPSAEPWGPVPPPDELATGFAYGVASGDPRQTSVVLWSALSPVEGEALTAQQVRWRLSTRPDLSDVVAEGELSAEAERGFCVKVLVEGLTPNTRYYYGFERLIERSTETGTAVATLRSHVGRTLTLPSTELGAEMGAEIGAEMGAEMGATSCTETSQGALEGPLSFGVTSCASYNAGYFHVYRALAEREDLAFVLHLGDYIYESSRYARPEVRPYEHEEEVRDLPAYRARYAHHKLDLDLQALHRAHPVIAVWDDHEFANNACPSEGGEPLEDDSGNIDPESVRGEAWERRKREAAQAYHEWLPTPHDPLEPFDEASPLYRAFELGGLATLTMLDTRMEGRDAPLAGASSRTERFSEARRLISPTQEAWLYEQLDQSVSAQKPWRLIAQQVMISQLQLRGALEAERAQALVLNSDQWDGFVAQRSRLLSHIQDNNIKGVVTLAGDLHTSWLSELSFNPSDPSLYHPNADEVGTEADLTGRAHGGAVALECVAPSVTSPALAADSPALLNVLSEANPHIKWQDLTRRGYLTLTLTPEELEAQWWLLESAQEPTYTAPTLAMSAQTSPMSPRWRWGTR